MVVGEGNAFPRVTHDDSAAVTHVGGPQRAASNQNQAAAATALVAELDGVCKSVFGLKESSLYRQRGVPAESVRVAFDQNRRKLLADKLYTSAPAGDRSERGERREEGEEGEG